MDREIYLSQHIDKYYTIFFGQPEENPCNNYLKMLEWTWNYYNGNCKDNYLYYEFHLAPLFKSIVNHIPCFNEELVLKKADSMPSAISQLIYVLPYDDYHLIPVNIDNIIKKYPNLKEMNNPVYYDFCKFFWEAHADFKYINFKELNKLCM